ncbi:MAG: hypothetical protein HOH43_16445 [Candidatus Latescibacteria bacterium]|nr:hypothetical protein [Candidatus Latescibacterota bacterium]
MRRIAICLIALAILSGYPLQTAHAITYYGSNGLVRVSSANNVFQGDLWGTFNFSYNQGGFSVGTYKNARGAVNLLYGIRQYLELGLSQVVYQDQAIFGNPGGGPLRVSLKGSLPRYAPSTANIAAQLIGLIPVGSISNVEHESYYSDKPSVGGMIVVSFDSNPVDLRRSKRLHINLGYMYHNDKSSFVPSLAGTSSGGKNTQQLLVGVAAQVPMRGANTLFAEISGEHYLSENPNLLISQTTTGAPAFFRLTPGVRSQFNKFYVQAGIDITVSSNGTYGSDGDFVTIYPKWKFFAGFQYRIFEGIPPTYRRGRSMRISGRSYYGYGRSGTTDSRGVGSGVIQNIGEREELLDQVERDLQEIREQRIRAQRELEELRRTLEEEPGR